MTSILRTASGQRGLVAALRDFPPFGTSFAASEGAHAHPGARSRRQLLVRSLALSRAHLGRFPKHTLCLQADRFFPQPIVGAIRLLRGHTDSCDRIPFGNRSDQTRGSRRADELQELAGADRPGCFPRLCMMTPRPANACIMKKTADRYDVTHVERETS